MNKELEELTQNIRKYQCHNCSASSFENCCCKVCHAKNEKLEQYSHQLEKILQKEKSYSLSELISLTAINKYNKTNTLSELLEKNKSQEKINKVINSIEETFNKKNISAEENINLIQLVNKNLVDDELATTITNFNMYNLVYSKLNVPVDYKLMLLQDFTKLYIKYNLHTDKVDCSYVDNMNNNHTGCLKHQRFYLDRINKIVYNKDYFVKCLKQKGGFVHIFNTMFHEITHLENAEVFSKAKSSFGLNYSKELILHDMLKDYYNENYNKNTDEVIARYGGITKTIEYLNKLGITMDINDSKIQNELKNEVRKLNDDSRTYKGVTSNINDIFDENIKDAKFLQQYPNLNVEYKNVENKLVRKSYDELKADYNKIDQNEKNFEINNLYDKLLNRQAKKEMFSNQSDNLDNTKSNTL